MGRGYTSLPTATAPPSPTPCFRSGSGEAEWKRKCREGTLAHYSDLLHTSTLFRDLPSYTAASDIHVFSPAYYQFVAAVHIVVVHTGESLGHVGFRHADACCKDSFAAKVGQRLHREGGHASRTSCCLGRAGAMPSFGNNLFIDKW